MQTRTPKVRPKKRTPKPKGKTAGKAGAANANAQVEAPPTPGPSQASRARVGYTALNDLFKYLLIFFRCQLRSLSQGLLSSLSFVSMISVLIGLEVSS